MISIRKQVVGYQVTSIVPFHRLIASFAASARRSLRTWQASWPSWWCWWWCWWWWSPQRWCIWWWWCRWWPPCVCDKESRRRWDQLRQLSQGRPGWTPDDEDDREQDDTDDDAEVDGDDNGAHPPHVFQAQCDRVVPVLVFAILVRLPAKNKEELQTMLLWAD